jgi:hypothetical protein
MEHEVGQQDSLRQHVIYNDFEQIIEKELFGGQIEAQIYREFHGLQELYFFIKVKKMSMEISSIRSNASREIMH